MPLSFPFLPHTLFVWSPSFFTWTMELNRSKNSRRVFLRKNNWPLCYSGWDNPAFLFQDDVGYRQCGRYMCPVLPNLPAGPVPPPLTHPGMLVCTPPISHRSWCFQLPEPLPQHSLGRDTSGLNFLHVLCSAWGHPDPPCQATVVGSLPERIWICSDFV